MRTTLLVAAAATVTFLGCFTRAVCAEASLPPGSRYVALGSSYAAGAGIGPLQPGSPQRCQRTTNNYPSLVARRLQLQLVDVSCGGATTAHLLGPFDELPAQLDALDATTRLVTVTVGGNDLDYMGALFGGSCRAGVAVRPGPCPAPVHPEAAQYRRLEASLATIAREIGRRAPQARLVFVQYLTAVPDKTCGATVLTSEDAENGRAIGRELAAVTARVAMSSGALLVPSDTMSRSHTACGTQPWSHGLYDGYDMRQGTPWHPAPAGHVAVANEIERLLRR